MEQRVPQDKKRAFNAHRRTFLAVASTGAIAFVLGKILGPSINLFSEDTVISEKEFQNFRIVETNKEMKFFDRSGSEVFIIDKESFKE